MKLEFPKNFLWGSATSAEQIEYKGFNPKNIKTIWEKWYDVQKYRFFDQKFSQNNFKEKYKEDLKIAKDLNFNSLRISISWARLIPDGKNINEKELNFYNNVFDEMKKNNLKIFVGLFHFDMPLWAQNLGGWNSKEVVDKYVYFAKVCFKHFGEKVDSWVTFNEPIVPVEGQYWYDFHYPNYIDFMGGIRAMWNILVAHHRAVKEFRKYKLNSKIGIILNITPSIPRSSLNKEDVKASKVADLFQWKVLLDTIAKGEFSTEFINMLEEKKLWPKDISSRYLDGVEKKLFQEEKIDFLGINYYCPLRVKSLDYLPNWKGTVTPHTHFYNLYEMPGRRMNPYRGWEIHPKSIYNMLMTIKNDYKNIPSYISENGMGVQDEGRYRDNNGKINDYYRIDFINEHLYWIHRAIKDGSNCFGYHMWTYIDNWSWINAYKNRYGFIELDLKTNKRIEKKSASWIKEVIKNNSINIEKDKIL